MLHTAAFHACVGLLILIQDGLQVLAQYTEKETVAVNELHPNRRLDDACTERLDKLKSGGNYRIFQVSTPALRRFFSLLSASTESPHASRAASAAVAASCTVRIGTCDELAPSIRTERKNSSRVLVFRTSNGAQRRYRERFGTQRPV